MRKVNWLLNGANNMDVASPEAERRNSACYIETLSLSNIILNLEHARFKQLYSGELAVVQFTYQGAYYSLAAGWCRQGWRQGVKQ